MRRRENLYARLTQLETSPPLIVAGDLDRWRDVLAGARRFVDTWDGKVHELGTWNYLELFGMHRFGAYVRRDCLGLALSLEGGDVVVSLTEHHATIAKPSGVYLPVTRHVGEQAVLAWELPTSK